MTEPTLLIVDDEPRNVKLLGAMLVTEHYHLLEAHSGEDALKMARKHLPDVILLDVMMPGMDGFEVTRQLKADPVTHDIPVILVTALEGVENRVKGLDAGADEFLSKPVRREELKARVHAMSRLARMHGELRIRNAVARNLSEDYDGKLEPGHTVLLIEDDRPLTELMRGALQRAGFEVLQVDGMAEALSLLSHILPNLIIIDILLPDGDGARLLDKLKTDPDYQDIPALVVTAVTDMKKRIDCYEYGADDYLIKPVDSAELVARTRAALRRADTQNRLKRNYVRVKADSLTDALTGAHSRRYLDADLTHRLSLLARNPSHQMSIAMLDIDHFKHINDQHGHLTGDQVLQGIVDLIWQGLRASDYVARFGGEEFCLVLPDTDAAEAVLVVERMRASIEATRFAALADRSVTVSVGVAQWRDESNAMALLAHADQALYDAKHGGRNRTCVFTAQLTTPAP